MSKTTILKNANIVNEGRIFFGGVIIEDQYIKKVFEGDSPQISGAEIIDLTGKYLIPGVIDDQVHFREPGLEYKADIHTESKAAVAGGVTSFMDMPNNNPPILTQDLLEQKYRNAARKSLANYSFYMGTSNDNLDEVLKTNPRNVCGIKVFMGSSTGNMLVDNPETLAGIFSKTKMLVATHCEDETTIQNNIKEYKSRFGEDVPVSEHPNIRSAEACYLSSSLAVGLAKKYGTRLHVLHLSTAKEMMLFDNTTPLENKKITAEVCVHHLRFDESAYQTKGTKVKWNPAIKTSDDRKALINALLDDRLDVVATDHAPHLETEKDNTYFKAPSGGPLVQHSLQAMLEFHHEGIIPLETVVNKMCHSPAICFNVEKRGFIREGWFADLTVVDLGKPSPVTKENILYKCGWSPFEGTTFRSLVLMTFVNGHKVYDHGRFDESQKGMRLTFER